MILASESPGYVADFLQTNKQNFNLDGALMNNAGVDDAFWP